MRLFERHQGAGLRRFIRNSRPESTDPGADILPDLRSQADKVDTPMDEAQDHGPYGNRAMSDIPADITILKDSEVVTTSLNFLARNFGLNPVVVPAVSGDSSTGAAAYDISSNPKERPYFFIGPK